MAWSCFQWKQREKHIKLLGIRFNSSQQYSPLSTNTVVRQKYTSPNQQIHIFSGKKDAFCELSEGKKYHPVTCWIYESYNTQVQNIPILIFLALNWPVTSDTKRIARWGCRWHGSPTRYTQVNSLQENTQTRWCLPLSPNVQPFLLIIKCYSDESVQLGKERLHATHYCSSKQFSNKDRIKDNSMESSKAHDLKFSKQDHPFRE